MAEVLEIVIPQISCSQCFPIGKLIPHSSSLGRGPLSLWVKKWGPGRHRDARGWTLSLVSTSVNFCSCLWLSCFQNQPSTVSPLSPLRKVFGKMETRNKTDRKLR